VNIRAVRVAVALLRFTPLLALACREPADPPNLIVILVDTLRADHLGYQGAIRPTSPRIDRLAAESVVFLNHYAHASRTGPSVASLFTGLYPRSHGVVNPLGQVDGKGVLAAERVTLAEHLRASGYRTAGFTANVNVAARFGFDQGFDNYELLSRKRAGEVNDAALPWLERNASGAPLFLFLHYVDPHAHYTAPEAYRGRFAPGTGRMTGRHRQLSRIVAGEIVPDDADWQRLAALYDEEILYFDSELARLLDRLAALGLLDSSVLALLSDHGEEFGDHGSALHGFTLYEEQLRIPLLIRAPGFAPRRVNSISRQIDVMPTLIDLLGLPLPDGLQGRSLRAEMSGLAPGDGTPESGRAVFAEASLRAGKIVRSRALLKGGWKLIESDLPEPREQLFHIASDPGERRDRSAVDPEVAERMRAELRAFVAPLPDRRGESVELEPDEIDELRALGYVVDSSRP